MKITINCRNYKIEPKIEAYIYDKIGKLEKYIMNKQAAVLHVELSKDKAEAKIGRDFVVEVTGFIPANNKIRARERAGSFMSVVDLVSEKVEAQLRRIKEKNITKRRKEN